MPALRAPFPYFGAKRLIANQVWQAIGDVASYCEPFAGSAAVLLARPGGAGRIETINDLSGHVCNFWRAVKHHHAGLLSLADQLDYPVIEIDLHSRHRWLVAREESLKAEMDADPDACDVKAAAWWAWGLSAWIGSGWCSPRGARWDARPHLTDTGVGVHGRTLSTQVPHLSSTGAGVLARSLVEKLPSIADSGKGTHSRRTPLETVIDDLAARIRRVRVLCGDWRRVVTPAALCNGPANGRVGLFLDPPYLAEADGKKRTMGLYGKEDSADVAAEAAAWARSAAEEHPTWRIVLAGYEGEHDMPGWEVVAWDTSTGLWGSGGYGRKAGNDAEANTARERLWLSPACDKPSRRGQELFAWA